MSPADPPGLPFSAFPFKSLFTPLRSRGRSHEITPRMDTRLSRSSSGPRAWPCCLGPVVVGKKGEELASACRATRLDRPRGGYLGQRGLTEGASHARLGHEPRPSDLLTISIVRAVRSPLPGSFRLLRSGPKQAHRARERRPPLRRLRTTALCHRFRSLFLRSSLLLSRSRTVPLFVRSLAILYPHERRCSRAQVKDTRTEARESLNRERGGERHVYFGARCSPEEDTGMRERGLMMGSFFDRVRPGTLSTP